MLTIQAWNTGKANFQTPISQSQLFFLKSLVLYPKRKTTMSQTMQIGMANHRLQLVKPNQAILM